MNKQQAGAITALRRCRDALHPTERTDATAEIIAAALRTVAVLAFLAIVIWKVL